YREELSRTYVTTGRAYAVLQRLDRALSCFDAALALRAQLLKAQPGNPAFLSQVAEASHLSGATHWSLGRRAEGVAAVERAVALQTAAYQKFPRVEPLRRGLGTYLRTLAGFQAGLGRPGALAAVARKRQELWPDSAAECFQAARELALCVALVARGKAE